jgi:putative transposase
MLKIVVDEAGREDLAADLDQIVREGARRMLAAALEAEAAEYVAALAAERVTAGRRGWLPRVRHRVPVRSDR